MRKIKLTCDSTCDLTPALYESRDIEVIPLGIILGDDLKYDGRDITASEVFDYVDKTGRLPKTSGISVGEYMTVFQKYVDQGFDVIHINLSSDLSVSHQNARLAAEEIDQVSVIDSRSLSSGSGHLALLAADLIEQGHSRDEIVRRLNEKKADLDVSFILQTLEYLHKGGRCSGLTALGAGALRIRPEIQVVDGRMQVGRKYRGKQDKSILSYVRGRLEGRNDIDLSRIIVTHSGVAQDILDRVMALIEELQPFEDRLITQAGCTISSHCGPDTLGLLFFRKTA